MILLIDNYDSFVHNLARYLQRLGQETMVVRNDAISIDQIDAFSPAAIVLSPGPCGPQQAGICLEVVRHLGDRVPLLGVCLGHQVIAQAYGGRIVRGPEPMHGRTSPITHVDSGMFAGLPNPFLACRYHSLIVDRASLPSCFEVTAWTAGDMIMGIQHRSHPCAGVQFHPEAILTECGYRLLGNFLSRVGITVDRSAIETPLETLRPDATPRWLPSAPVTF